ncbi:MAG: M48 family metallopeptidase [Flavobacteriales bacterium]|nr:M48 family metallopeptidase [Flavobacteriales bacterium]
MREKLLIDLLKLALLFGAIWAFFYFVPLFPEDDVFEVSIEKEDALGDLIVEDILFNSPDFHVVSNPILDSAFQIITDRLLDNVELTEYDYTIRVVENSEINAFTLPGGNIFVYTGLLEFAESPEEVAAVLSHEIGHVEKRHVMSKLVKEFGINLLFSILTGGDAVILGELAKTALSTVFDRRQETEADNYAFELLVKSEISPTAMAAFFRRVKRELGGYDESLEILMSHPHFNARIKASLEYQVPEGFANTDFGLDWEKVQNSLSWSEAD